MKKEKYIMYPMSTEKELMNGPYGMLTMLLKQTNDKISELEKKEATVSELIVMQELIEQLKQLQTSLCKCMIDYKKNRKHLGKEWQPN